MPLSVAFPPVIYFYGLSGAGKNYVGDIAGELTGGYVYHADVDLTPEILSAIEEKRPFTDAMRDPYYAIVASRILELKKQHELVVVSQATYKKKHRDYMLSRVSGMEMVCIDADPAAIIERLSKRGNAITPEYAASMRADFDPPPQGVKIIENNAGKAEIVAQLERLYPMCRPSGPHLKALNNDINQ